MFERQLMAVRTFFLIFDVSHHHEKGGTCSTYGGKEGCIHSFGGEPEGTPFVIPIRRWKDTIKMDHQEVGPRWGHGLD